MRLAEEEKTNLIFPAFTTYTEDNIPNLLCKMRGDFEEYKDETVLGCENINTSIMNSGCLSVCPLILAQGNERRNI